MHLNHLQTIPPPPHWSMEKLSSTKAAKNVGDHCYRVHVVVSQTLFLPQCLDATDPGMPLPPASHHPPTLFPVAIFGISYSAILSHRDQLTPFFELNSLFPTNHELPDSSESSHRGGGCRPPPGQQVSAGLLHLPASGLLFPLSQCNLRA